MPGKKNSRSKSASKPTADDAKILLKLFDLRREEMLRKARNFVLFEWQPRTNEEFTSVLTAFGSQEQTNCRMVLSYWDQAASLVIHGVVNPALFDEFSGELYFLYAKYKDFVPALRQVMPNAMGNIEKVANATAEGRARVERMQKMIAERFRPRAAKTGS